MAGYWPSSFFCVFMDRDGVEVHKLAKKNEANIQPSWPHTGSIKDLLYGFRGNFSCGTRRVLPSGQDSSILPARLANHSAGLSCPLMHGTRHIIKGTEYPPGCKHASSALIFASTNRYIICFASSEPVKKLQMASSERSVLTNISFIKTKRCFCQVMLLTLPKQGNRRNPIMPCLMPNLVA